MYPTSSNQKNVLSGFYTLYLFQKMYFNSKMSKIGKEGSCVSGKLNDVQCNYTESSLRAGTVFVLCVLVSPAQSTCWLWVGWGGEWVGRWVGKATGKPGKRQSHWHGKAVMRTWTSSVVEMGKGTHPDDSSIAELVGEIDRVRGGDYGGPRGEETSILCRNGEARQDWQGGQEIRLCGTRLHLEGHWGPGLGEEADEPLA